jgi:hypothetical protein
VLRKTLVFLPLIGLLGWGTLSLLQWKLKLGDYAKSPQELSMTRYERKVVAGGRAGVEYLGLENAKLRFQLHCLENAQTAHHPLLIPRGERSEKVCGVYLEVLETKGSDAFAIRLLVSWDKK